jgi:alanine dehydrogenase
MRVGIPKESGAGETRVAVIPAGVATLTKAGLQVAVETNAGLAAGFTDAAYTAQGATIVPRAEALATSDIVLQVR